MRNLQTVIKLVTQTNGHKVNDENRYHDRLKVLYRELATIAPEMQRPYWDKLHMILTEHIGGDPHPLWDVFTGKKKVIEHDGGYVEWV